MVVQETETGGVPTLVADATGPLRAVLMFRVGYADETLARSGTTHVVEHLALHRLGVTDYHYNATVRATTTMFHTTGSAEEVIAFLHGVCSSLHNLPMDRLEIEKGILRTERKSRSRSVNEAMPLWRYGARGYGLASYAELGIGAVTEEHLREWVGTWFTRGNAVLAVAGPGVPDGLRLELPDGPRRPAPEPTSALPRTPAYFTNGTGAVVLDSVVRRAPAVSVFATVLERELYRTLRHEGGVSYAISVAQETRGDGYNTVTAAADGLPNKQAAVLGGFLAVLAKLKAGRTKDADIAAVKAKALEALAHPEAESALLAGQAIDLLTGQPLRDRDAIAERLSAVSVEDVNAVAVEAIGSALLMVPQGQSADWAGFAQAPMNSTGRATGRTYQSLAHTASGLVVGADAVSFVHADTAATVRYDECQALLRWPDGARQLIGADGITVSIEPTLFADGPAAVSAIDDSAPVAVVVPMPARDPDAIP
jgi:zinc protease